jgi:TonB family protein
MTLAALFALYLAMSASAQPEAYVPRLVPRQRVEPSWPDEARKKEIQGLVRVLVAIDAEGRVQAAEVLMGPDELRESAVAAVRQWRFQPVLRAGRAVTALTDQTVIFRLRDREFSANNLNLLRSTDDARAAALRLARLEKQFPRSPEQALADLERDCAGVEGRERETRMNELAKAALSAGVVDKAAAWGEEMLRATGAAMAHRGHTILGLVALRRDDVDAARRHLLQSAQTEGDAALRSFGPSMALARALLEREQQEAVVEYLVRCGRFWKSVRRDEWEETVREGGAPDFQPNVRY